MILFFLLGIAIATIGWRIYYKLNWSKGVLVKLWFDKDIVYAEESTNLYEVIENRKSLPVPVLEVGFHTKKELDFAQEENTSVSDYIYKRDIFSVLGWQKITREIPVKCTKRGFYEIKETDIMTSSLLYKKSYRKSFENNISIYVYPKQVNVSDIMSVCERMLGELQCSKKLYEDPFAFRTIRAYTTDDPMKTVNWKASAKTGNLMVNTFDSVLSQKAMIFLDIEDEGILKYDALVEESIAIAASLVRKLLKQGIETGFAFNGGELCFLPTNQKSKLIMLERTLAEYDSEKSKNAIFSYTNLFDKTKYNMDFSEDTLLIFVTKNLSERLYSDIKQYIGNHYAVMVNPVTRTQAAARDYGYESISEKISSNFSIKNKDKLRILVKRVD